MWQGAKALTESVYSEFEESKDFGFRDQIQRAALSVMNNIAEGFERRSQNELKRFLYIAKGSCGEVRSMLILARDFDYISEERFTNMHDQSVKISKMLSKFITKVQSES